MQTFAQKYPALASAIHTFVATFVVTIVGLIAAIPADSILAPQTWTTSAIVALITAGVRAGVKAISPLSV